MNAGIYIRTNRGIWCCKTGKVEPTSGCGRKKNYLKNGRREEKLGKKKNGMEKKRIKKGSVCL